MSVIVFMIVVRTFELVMSSDSLQGVWFEVGHRSVIGYIQVYIYHCKTKCIPIAILLKQSLQIWTRSDYCGKIEWWTHLSYRVYTNLN